MFGKCFGYVLETGSLGDLLKLLVLPFKSHAPQVHQRSIPINKIIINFACCYKKATVALTVGKEQEDGPSNGTWDKWSVGVKSCEHFQVVMDRDTEQGNLF